MGVPGMGSFIRTAPPSASNKSRRCMASTVAVPVRAPLDPSDDAAIADVPVGPAVVDSITALASFSLSLLASLMAADELLLMVVLGELSAVDALMEAAVAALDEASVVDIYTDGVTAHRSTITTTFRSRSCKVV